MIYLVHIFQAIWISSRRTSPLSSSSWILHQFDSTSSTWDLPAPGHRHVSTALPPYGKNTCSFPIYWITSWVKIRPPRKWTWFCSTSVVSPSRFVGGYRLFYENDLKIEIFTVCHLEEMLVWKCYAQTRDCLLNWENFPFRLGVLMLLWGLHRDQPCSNKIYLRRN